MALDVGIGLTANCNCNCEHCYSRIYENNSFLDIDKLIKLVNKYDISNVNFGTGESIYHPSFTHLVELLHKKGVKISLTTNGYTSSKLSDEDIKKFHDIDFSLDYPTMEMHNKSRGNGQYEMVLYQIKRCQKLGVPVSIAWCLGPYNMQYVKEMIYLCRQLDIYLRINIYKPVENLHGFTYDQFWLAIQDVFAYSKIITCSEPIINAVIKNDKTISKCGRSSIRIFPNGYVSSCVYINNESITLDDLMSTDNEEQLLSLFSNNSIHYPEDPMCIDCDLKKFCFGGCVARRHLHKQHKEEYCFYINHKSKPALNAEFDNSFNHAELVHSDYICTIIVKCK